MMNIHTQVKTSYVYTHIYTYISSMVWATVFNHIFIKIMALSNKLMSSVDSRVEIHSSLMYIHSEELTTAIVCYLKQLPIFHGLLPFLMTLGCPKSIQWRHNGGDSVSNHQPHDCFLNRLSRRRSKKISKLRVIGLCAGKSPGTGEFPAQMASNAENVSIWWRHHVRVMILKSSTLWYIWENSAK